MGGSLYSDFFYDIPAQGECRYIHPLSLSFDVGISPSLTVGAQVAYAFNDFTPNASNANAGEANYNHLFLGGRVMYHFTFLKGDRFIPYVGGMAGYELISGDDGRTTAEINVDFSEPANRFAYNAVVGLKGFITNNIGLYLEGGLGFSNVNTGVTIRL